MLFSIHEFNQQALVDAGLDNTDALLLYWLRRFIKSGAMKTTEHKGNLYYWVKHDYVIQELPILGIQNSETISRRLKKIAASGVLEKHIVKKHGTYTFYRFNDSAFSLLMQKQLPEDLLVENDSGQNISPPSFCKDICTEPVYQTINESAVEDTYSTEMACDARPINRPKDPNTINHINLIVGEAEKNKEFIRSFNDFCIGDSNEYRNNTSYWIFHHAAKYSNSLQDIIHALNTCCDKGKEGNIAYLTGILRTKAANRSMGIIPFGKPEQFQVTEYLRYRLSGHMEYLTSYDLDFEDKTVYCNIREPEAKDSLNTVLNEIVAPDVLAHTGVSLQFAMR